MMATISYDLLQDCSAASLQPILSHYKNVVLTGLMVTHSAGHGRHVGVWYLLDIWFVQPHSVAQGWQQPMLARMLRNSLLSDYFPQTVTVLFVLLEFHLELMRLESGLPREFGHTRRIEVHFLQVKDLLSYFEVFALDSLLFQFSGTHVQALRPVFMIKLSGRVTLGQEGLQTVCRGDYFVWLTLLPAWISTSFLSSFWFSWSICSCFSTEVYRPCSCLHYNRISWITLLFSLSYTPYSTRGEAIALLFSLDPLLAISSSRFLWRSSMLITEVFGDSYVNYSFCSFVATRFCLSTKLLLMSPPPILLIFNYISVIKVW